MKKLLNFTLSLALACMVFNVSAQNANATTQANADGSGPQMVFETKTIDYGTIEHNANGVREFKFTNTGKEALIIQNAKGSCGCTVPTWPREPIAPGASNVIKVKYATNRVGSFQKTVTLTTNVEGPPIVLTIKGKVLPDPPAPANQNATPGAGGSNK